MNEKQWLNSFFSDYARAISTEDVHEKLSQFKDLLLETQDAGKKVILAGNGASAAISSHAAVDFTKTAGVRATTFNETDLITCFANDHGYENWVKVALEHYADKGDLLVLVSSSGRSPNMLRAAEYASSQGNTVVTFTGFAVDNPLKSLGDLNFWANSLVYNIVENVHQFWLCAACDLIAAEKSLLMAQKVAH